MSGTSRAGDASWPAIVLGASLAAMWMGLCIDARTVAPESLIGLCSGPAPPLVRLLADWRFMPVSHGLMLSAAMATTIAGECTRNDRERSRWPRLCLASLCLAAMLVGMGLSGRYATQLAGLFSLSPFAAIAMALGVGMVAGMAAVVPLTLVATRLLRTDTLSATSAARHPDR